MSEEIGYQTFGKKAYWLFLSRWFETPVAFLLVAFGLSFAGRSGYVPVEYQRVVSVASLTCLGIALVSAIVCVIVSRIVFRSQEFCLSDDAFKLRQGVFRKHEIAIPYHQIQNVDIERTLYQQAIGVSKLIIMTGGDDDITTPGNDASAILMDIDKDVAVNLQNDLLHRADVQKVVETAPQHHI